MAKMVTLENTGVSFDSFRTSMGLVSMSENTCKDFPESVAGELKQEYTHLKVVASYDDGLEEPVFVADVEPAQVLDEADAKTDGKPKDFLEQLQESQIHICSVCSEKFNSHKGMRSHMGRVHK